MASAFSDDISIDLGTANTLVHVAGRGIIIDEPSVVAVRPYRGVREIIAVGRKAKALIGRTPESLEIVRPLRDGVIADFVATEEMLRQFIKRAKTMLGFRRPRILICVPAGATPVERRAVFRRGERRRCSGASSRSPRRVRARSGVSGARGGRRSPAPRAPRRSVGP